MRSIINTHVVTRQKDKDMRTDNLSSAPASRASQTRLRSQKPSLGVFNGAMAIKTPNGWQHVGSKRRAQPSRAQGDSGSRSISSLLLPRHTSVIPRCSRRICSLHSPSTTVPKRFQILTFVTHFILRSTPEGLHFLLLLRIDLQNIYARKNMPSINKTGLFVRLTNSTIGLALGFSQAPSQVSASHPSFVFFSNEKHIVIAQVSPKRLGIVAHVVYQ